MIGPYSWVKAVPGETIIPNQPNQGSVKRRNEKKKIRQQRAFMKVAFHNLIVLITSFPLIWSSIMRFLIMRVLIVGYLWSCFDRLLWSILLHIERN